MRSAIREDGGTGRIGIGRINLAVLLGPNVKFSVESSPVAGCTGGPIDTGNVDMGNPPTVTVSW